MAGGAEEPPDAAVTAGRREGLAALAVALVAIFLSSGPRLYLYLTAPADQLFLGQVWGVYDLPRYVLLTRQAAAGAWLFDDRLLRTDHARYLLYTPYIALGHLLGWTGLSALAMVEILRWVAIPLALAASWLFVRTALPPGRRALGYGCAVLSGGLGVLALGRPDTALGPIVPLDITAPSFTIMNSLNMAPHVSLAVAGLAVFAWGLLEASAGRWRGLAGVPALAAVASFHAFVVPCLLLAAAIFWLWRGRRRQVLAVLVLAALTSIPFGLYQLWIAINDSAWGFKELAELENLPSLLVSRALLWPFIAIGAVAALRDREARPGPALALCWAASALLLDLAPPLMTSELHRTVEGSPLAYGVLAAIGLGALARRWRTYLLAASLLAPLLEGTFLVIAGSADAEAFMPVADYRLAARMNDLQVTSCVVGSDLTMLWTTALSQSCDAIPNRTLVPGVLRRLAEDGPSRGGLPPGAGYVLWGRREREYGPPPRGLQVAAREGEAELLLLP